MDDPVVESEWLQRVSVMSTDIHHHSARGAVSKKAVDQVDLVHVASTKERAKVPAQGAQRPPPCPAPHGP
jgi:hypothetical protein